MKILEWIRALFGWRTKEEKRSAGEYRLETIKMSMQFDYAPAAYRAFAHPENPHAQSDYARRTRILTDLINNDDVRYVIDPRILYMEMAEIEEQANLDVAVKQAKEVQG